MQTITTRAGLAWADAASKLDDTSWKASAEANRVALSELGLWGVPSLAVAGLSSWGQDRIAWIDERLSAG
jgi:2-hydroxychromene-2-carboxylate isomerase